MYSKTIITSLGLLSLSCSAQASQSPRLYTLGGYNNVYSSQYDSTFGMSLKGVYSFCNDEVCGVELPDLKGAQLGLHTNIQGSSVYHELSLNVGLLYGSKSQDQFLWNWRQSRTAYYSCNIRILSESSFD